MIQARSYQTEAVSSIFNYFTVKQGNPLVAMPTGTGKSIVIALFLQSVFHQYPDQRILCLTHVKELIEQNYDKLLAVWPNAPCGIYSAGLKRRDTINKIVFGGIASVAKRWAEFGFINLVIIDEAHLVNPTEETMYRSFLEGLKSINPHLKVIGLTATPWRLGHGKIIEDGIFTDTCFDITGMLAFNRLIAEGYLCPVVPKQTTTMLDTEGVHTRGGEFVASELQNAVDKGEITSAAIREAMEVGHDRRHWLIFCSGVEHAVHVSDMLNTFGISCVSVHSKLSSAQRDENIRKFKCGEVQAITNNNVLTTGFDMPAIDLILVLRPTQSPVLWVQMLGRGTRPFQCEEYKKNNCLVLDFAGNTRRLGPINDPVIPKRKGEKGGEAPIKLCERCGTYNHASARFCGGEPYETYLGCGNEFVIMTKLKQAASTADLIKGDMPVVEMFKVDTITITRHEKHDKPPSMKVTYYCGLKHFEDYVCIEHEGFASRKARQWWRDRSATTIPATTDEALARAGELVAATHLQIWVNKKYPEILKYCFDNTAFGTMEPSDGDAGPSINVAKVTNFAALKLQANEIVTKGIPNDLGDIGIECDDIPF